MKRYLTFISLSILSFNALADNCDKALSTYDSIYCTNKLYASTDDELNKNYKELRKLLNPSQKSTLKQSQLAWIKERDDLCVNGNSVSVECRLELTQERNNWLRERIRECKTIGCISQKLAEVGNY